MRVAIWFCISDYERQQLVEFQRVNHHRDLHPPGHMPQVEKDLARIMTERPKADFHEVGR